MTPLEEILRDRIRSGGPIPFRDFMAAALYHPEHGYYRAGRPRIGREGDYFTSSHVHAAFGESLAGQVREMAGFLGEGGPFWVIEAGPGEGYLAADLLRALASGPEGGPERFRLGLIEPSEAGRGVQAGRLRGIPGAGQAVWWGGLEEAAAGGARDGCLLANELLDAMPVHRVVGRGGGIREIFVGEGESGFVEVEGEPTTAAIGDWFESDGIRLEDGQEAEVGLDALDWIAATSAVIRRGYLLIVDFGHPARVLYAPERRSGTLLSYHRHTASTKYYADPGERDLAAHVNFTAVRRAAAAAGWEFCGETDQMRFLIALGILDRMSALADRTDSTSVRERLALRQLILPGGMGEVFRVLAFRRGGVPGELRGLRHPFREGSAAPSVSDRIDPRAGAVRETG